MTKKKLDESTPVDQDVVAAETELILNMKLAGCENMFPLNFGKQKKNKKKKKKKELIPIQRLTIETKVSRVHKRFEVEGQDNATSTTVLRHNKEIMLCSPDAIRSDVIKKYWDQRYRLFSRFDQGIVIDYEGWFSVTPETISKHLAERVRSDIICDPFCGVGGNIIRLAMTCNQVIAIDIDERKIACAKHNAKVYGVEDRIEFIVGDALTILPYIKADVIFLSPPWGGPEYINASVFDIDGMMVGNVNGSELFHLAFAVTPNIAYFLPRNIDPHQVAALATINCEVEKNYINNKLKTVTVYYGELAANFELAI